MENVNAPICQVCAGNSGSGSAQRADVPAETSRLFEPIVGLVTMSRICAYVAQQDKPDMVELRRVLGMLVASSETALGVLQAQSSGPKGNAAGL